jgi:iron complex transport system substrate-binding protein
LKFRFMPFKLIYLTALAVLFILTGCNTSPEKKEERPVSSTTTLLKYARRFSLESKGALTLVHVFGNRLKPGDTTATYAIGSDSSDLAGLPHRSVFIKRPCKKIAALSSIYANIIYDLGNLDQLVAIDNLDYVVNPQIIAKYKRGGLKELAKGPVTDLEQTISLNPDIVFTFGMGEPGRDVNPKLLQSGIPIAVSIDHLEESPLARAEWIKFYAAFTGKEKLADSLFAATEKNYLELTALAIQATRQPLVFTEMKYGDTWYVPGGKSYVAQLLKDAGADYVWKEDANAGSLPLSFEQVYTKARLADFWLNPSMVKTKAELLSYEPRYAEFKAFKTGGIYNNNKVANEKGYSTYWETGMTYPNRILGDLIRIFHPELETGTKNDLYYYQQIH